MILRPFLILAALAPLAVADTAIYEAPPISYSTTKPADPATHLQSRLDAGHAQLNNDGTPLDLLASLLRDLDIPVSSQTLVFSRTSLQRSSISPENPRALYFNDETYVGYVPGARLVEVATTDPRLGTTFYTLDQHPASSAVPKLRRQVDNCLSCHGGNMTRDLPGLLLRSVYPDSAGEPILPAGTFLTNHESPFDQRWGGWYATGPLPAGSLANLIFDDSDPSNPKPVRTLDPAKSFDPSHYLSPHSDPVAMLVLAHQVEGHNRLSRALYSTELAIRDEEIIAKALEEPVPVVKHSESTLRRIHHACDPLVEYLLFCKEPPLPGPVASPTTFAADFAARGPKDPQGRSLRDLDLHTRLFKYPCSYLIYSPSFDALPAPARDYVYQRLYAILTGQDTSKPFDRLTFQDRQAILEILRATKPNLPPDWTQPATP